MKIMIAASAALLASGAALAQQGVTPPPSTATPPAGTAAPAGTTEDSLSRSRMSTSPVSPAETSARDSLMRGGYSDIRDWVKDGDGWKGTALYNGQRVEVRVGADGKPVRAPQD